MHLLNAKTESPHAVEDVVGRRHPFERCAPVVVGADVREDGDAQLRDARDAGVAPCLGDVPSARVRGLADTTGDGSVRCFLASAGDLLLASGAYAVTALVFWRPAWPIRPDWILPAATWIAIGVMATSAFERWALAPGRWAYGPDMPLVFGIGLLPLLQWIVVPVLTLAVLRWWRNHAVRPADRESTRR